MTPHACRVGFKISLLNWFMAPSYTVAMMVSMSPLSLSPCVLMARAPGTPLARARRARGRARARGTAARGRSTRPPR